MSLNLDNVGVGDKPKDYLRHQFSQRKFHPDSKPWQSEILFVYRQVCSRKQDIIAIKIQKPLAVQK